MGLYGRRALERAEEKASHQATRVGMASERERLAALSVQHADAIDAAFAMVQLEVSQLAQAYNLADPRPTSSAQLKLSKLYQGAQAGGLPGYGFVEPRFDAYGDFLRRGDQCPWVPRHTMTRLRGDTRLRAEVIDELHRSMAMGPQLAALGARNGAELDLAWIVTSSGVTNVWPPYDLYATIAENPDVLDLDEATMDYVRLGAPEVNPERGPVWTDPYLDRFKGVWVTSVIHPLYVGEEFHGTVGADLLLATITERVRAFDLGLPGYPILLGPHGEVVATTEAGVADLAWDPAWQAALQQALLPPTQQTWTDEREAGLAKGGLASAPDAAWTALLTAARSSKADVLELSIGGDARLAAYAPVKTAGWALVLVVPTDAVAAQADTISAAVGEGARGLANDFSIFASVVVGLTLASALFLQVIAIRPLQSLAQRVARATSDDLKLAEDPSQRAAEFGELEGKINELLALLSSARDVERQDRARLSAILASIADALIATTPDGRVTLLNPGAEALLGISNEAALGRPFAAICPLLDEVDGRPLPDPVVMVQAAGRAMAFPERLLLSRPAGNVAVELRGAPQPDGRSGVVLLLRDATETRRFEEQFVRAQKLESVQVLAARIAHDFNNLLGGILGFVSLARVAIPADSLAQGRLERAEAAIDRGRALTAQLVTFSEGGAPIRESTAGGELIRIAAENVLRDTETGLDLRVDEELPRAEVDAGQLVQVVQNLVKNAAESMGGRGRVGVSVTSVQGRPGGLPEGLYLEVSVSDAGSGVGAADRARIFDPFFSTRPGASGLGLAVCFSVVRQHHGNIELTHTGSDGSRFTFWLPALVDGVAPGLAPSAAARLGRVLFMDDDEDLRDITAAMFEQLGYACTQVADGAAAIAAVEAALRADDPFVLFMLDLTVPTGMGGVEALPHLRKLDPNVPAVVCSGYGKDPVLANPSAYGFAGKLRKPFDLAALQREITRALRR